MSTLLKKSPRWSLGAIAALSVVAAVGCGRLPLEPEVSTQRDVYEAPVFAQVPRSGDAFGASPTGIQSGSQDVDGAVGGTVTVGRFSVIVPAGAFDGVATIHVTIPDPTVMACDLHITPESANDFAVPVTLRADCAGVFNVELENCGTLWFDPSINMWRTVGGTAVDPVNDVVSAELEHFSRYGVADLLQGKASW